jgi:hypothetical protein
MKDEIYKDGVWASFLKDLKTNNFDKIPNAVIKKENVR